ncbi:MAG: SpoIIE family protein phosphatase [Candidatus Aminicenantes bacterium]|nr:SpoIIE family protein phosphatase [Candidatus Aminicenantes bacterium]
MRQCLKKKLKGKAPSKKKRVEPDKSMPDELSLSGMRERQVSPLNSKVWRFVLLISAGCIAAWILQILFGLYRPFVVWVVALVAGASWVVAIRMLLLESRLRKFWIVWLSGGALFIFLLRSSDGIWIVSLSFVFVFLLFRRYMPYRHLTSRRRSGLFLIGFVILILLISAWVLVKQEAPAQPQPADSSSISAKPSGLVVLGHNLAKYSLWSLQHFWLFSLLHLFFGIRLHFMRLKPKLAISAFLIAVVPLFLVFIMGLLTLYSILGESRAARAITVMEDWANLAVLDENFIQTISDRSFSYDIDGKKIQGTGDEPAWLPGFLSFLKTENSPYKEWAAAERAKYFWIGSDLWLINLSTSGKPKGYINGCKVNSIMMNRIAKILKCNIKFSYAGSIFSGEDVNIQVRENGSKPDFNKISGTFFPEDGKEQESEQAQSSFWRRLFYFGITHLDVIYFDTDLVGKQTILLTIQTSISTILRELFSEKNPLSLVVMIALLSLALLMFFLETFVLIFGVRITTGITSAVKTLHRGTRRIAEGDLDTKIVIPSEDELGDLATSFNVMAGAVKKGREEAIAREHLERELETARQIQEKLLPHEMPQLPGFEIAGTSLPSQQVGGDYFDFLDMGIGQLGIAIADVSGKGIPAALLMANLQASLHAQVIKKGSVADVASRMNSLLVKSTDTHMFATFFYGILDQVKSTFTSTNAGHNPPLLFRVDGKIKRLEAGGLVLGFLPDQKYNQQTVKIKQGEVVVLFTDGITEAAGASSGKISENLFGEERLIEVVRASLTKSAVEIQAAILQAISDHTANAPQYDDITLVVIKRTKQKA